MKPILIFTFFILFSQIDANPKTNLKPTFGGTYERLISNLPETFDPAFVTDADSSEVVAQLYSRLFRMGTNLKASPDIVRSWEISDDQKTYTFYLREKIRFHTILGDNFDSGSYTTKNRGRELSAYDVKFSFERVLSPKTKSPHMSTLLSGVKGVKEFQNKNKTHIEGIKVDDENTLIIELNAPTPSFLMELSSHALSIVAKEDIQANKNQMHLHPVGTGPFILEGFDIQKDLTLRANLDYFKGRPYLDAIHFTFQREKRLNSFKMFQNKKLHHIANIPRKELKESIKSKDYSFYEKPSLEIQYLAFNIHKKPFNKVKVRQAFNFAVNKEIIVKYILNNRGFIANSPLPPGILGYNKDLNPYPFDQKKAKKLLLEAGYHFDENGLVIDFPEIKLYVTGRKGSTNIIGRTIQSNLLDIGIEIKLVLQNWSKHYQSVDTDEASFFTMGWILDYADADNVLRYNFTCNNIQNHNNASKYCNPNVDQLIESARFTNNPKHREKFYLNAQKKIMQDAPWICLYHPTTYILSQKNVHGIELSSFGESEFNYHNIWLSNDKKEKKKP
ncbi:MAG: hypothetical protein COB02_07860 [Candidatus Cloacimonadota bacterium]|nr:MAG: hypothetical protein COB02_07860 [Candidatus Cloacimonadota bacterium]